MFSHKQKNIFIALFLVLSLLFALPLYSVKAETAESSEAAENESTENETTEESESPEESPAIEYPLTLKDSDGTEVTLDEEPKAIVSLGPNMTEMVFALGAGDRLVGRTTYCDYPAEVENIEAVGTLQEPDLEKITELNPDLILASTHVKDEVIEKFRELKIPVLSLYESEDFQGVFKMVKTLSDALNLPEEGAALLEQMQAKYDFVERSISSEEKPTVYYVVGFGEGGDYTAGGNTFINGLLEAAGVKNVAGDIEGWSFSQEKLIEADPDFIILPQWADGQFQETEPYKDLKAVKENHVLAIDNNTIDRQGPRNLDALMELARFFHADAFKETQYPVELIDSNEETLKLEKRPERIISLGPNMTEFVFALGAGDRLVGRTDYCDYPEEVSEIASVGTLMEPDLEKIAELEPDLVLSSTHVSEDVMKKLQELKIPVLYLYDEHNLYGLSQIILTLGTALDVNEAAMDLEKDVMGRILAVRYASERQEPVSVYYVVGFGEGGDYTAGSNTFIHDILSYAGFKNIAADVKDWSYSAEKLVEADPDYIIIPAWADGLFQTTAPYSELSAVKNEKVIVADNNLFDRQGPRNADAMEFLQKVLKGTDEAENSEASESVKDEEPSTDEETEEVAESATEKAA